MGVVYQAWDEELGIPVALKLIRPESLTDPEAAKQMERRFKRELVLARQVTHKHVVRIHDLGELGGVKYFTMPFIDGQNLAAIIAREGSLPVARALSIARQVAGGLAAAHEVGVVHRDLKPENVMVDGDDMAVIMDFGLARTSDGTNLTRAGAVMGTLPYMAPEQARGEVVDQRADIYAWGLMLYDMLAGRRRTGHHRDAMSEMLERMQHAPAPLRSLDPRVPEALNQVIARCVEPDPANRYQTTADLMVALDALDAEGHAPILMTPAPAPDATRRYLVMAAGVVLVLAAIGVGYWANSRPTVVPTVTSRDPVYGPDRRLSEHHGRSTLHRIARTGTDARHRRRIVHYRVPPARRRAYRPADRARRRHDGEDGAARLSARRHQDDAGWDHCHCGLRLHGVRPAD